MPEDGGRGSLDYALREMLRDNFPQLMCQHNSDSRKAHRGWPDWVIGGRGGVIFRELKREATQPTAEQREWLATLGFAGLDAGVWRPSDLLCGRIARELAAIAAVPGLVVSPP